MKEHDQTTTGTATRTSTLDDVQDYCRLLAEVTRRFDRTASDQILYTTDATGLFDAYLAAFPEADRQYHNCNACRHFIERYGGLVVIQEDGLTVSPFWTPLDAPPAYRASIAAVERLVNRARVTGVFYTKEPVWGSPVTGPWIHYSVAASKQALHTNTLLSPFQVMAAKREDHQTVSRALREFPQWAVEQAVGLLRTESLYRSEAVLGQAEWLLKLHEDAKKARVSANVIWRAVAKAPAGFCHPRTSMIGTLLEDIAQNGLSFETIAKKFAAKMDPLLYQRPQAPPKAGNIEQAEKLFEQMALAPALKRRIARLDEIPKVWEPKAEPEGSGIFGFLKAKKEEKPDLVVPATEITWDKFFKTVLPKAEQVEFRTSHETNDFIVVTTAVDPKAPPIMQWDSLDHRNPFAWYCWSSGADPRQFGLSHHVWVPVVGITRLPARWGDDGERFAHQGDGVVLLLKEARESRKASLCLFPQFLRAELHSVRSVIEAYSASREMEGLTEGSAIGYNVRKSREKWEDVLLRVTTGTLVLHYRIVRWD